MGPQEAAQVIAQEAASHAPLQEVIIMTLDPQTVHQAPAPEPRVSQKFHCQPYPTLLGAIYIRSQRCMIIDTFI